jgi:prephenate dehydrogenase
VVITALPENAAADVERVARAWRACDAIIHRLTPEEHDKVFAAVSHLPHLLAYALVDDIAKNRTPTCCSSTPPAASAISPGSPVVAEMWRDISLANQRPCWPNWMPTWRS